MPPDIVLCQGDSINYNYDLKKDLTFKEVYFKFSKKSSPSETRMVKCIQQSFTSPDFKLWVLGGVCIPFSNEDLLRDGDYLSQFKIIKDGIQETYPQNGYLTMRVQKSL